MGYIYAISNSINEKVYVGQTIYPIEKRFAQHKAASKRDSAIQKSKLYKAMHKYGCDKFNVSLIEECSDDCLNDREIYWIKKLDSFNRGYNATRGGEGHLCDDEDSVMQCWNSGMTVKGIIEATGHSEEYVVRVLTKNGIVREERNQRGRKIQGQKVKVPVYQYDLDGKYVGEYASIWDAEKETGIHHNCINGVLCGVHFSAGFYQWSREKVDNIGKCKHRFCGTARTIYQYTIDGEYVREHPSFSQAASAVGLKSILPIRRVCYGKAHTSRGYRWSLFKYDKLPIPEREVVA